VSVIAEFFCIIKTLDKYQVALQDFGEYKKVWKEFADEIESYDKEEGISKHGKTKPMTPEKAKEKDYKIAACKDRDAHRAQTEIGGGRPSFGQGDRMPQAFVNQL
jgi:hypothetical protein